VKHFTLSKVVEQTGVNRRTFKRWMNRCGYARPRSAAGRSVLLIPEWMLEKFIEEHSPRIPRVSGVVVSHEANR